MSTSGAHSATSLWKVAVAGRRTDRQAGGQAGRQAGGQALFPLRRTLSQLWQTCRYEGPLPLCSQGHDYMPIMMECGTCRGWGVP